MIDKKESYREYQKKYREEHREKLSEYQKKYREEHKEERKEYTKKYYEENKERYHELNKKRYQEHKEERLEYNREWRKNNREKHLESNRRYLANHREENKERLKKRYQEHLDEYREYHHRRYIENKDKIAEYDKEYRKKNREKIKRRRCLENQTQDYRANNLRRSYRFADAKKGFDISDNIDKDWIIENLFSGQKCIYCGESDWRLLGADRIDNDKPHTADNVVCSCGLCNIRRNRKSMTVEEFIEYRKTHPRAEEEKPIKCCTFEEKNGVIFLKKYTHPML